ncbi:MAG: type II/IV secretion system ATPase subunit [Candidatus Pacearchaeota archaeon]
MTKSYPSINLNPPIPPIKKIEDKTKVNVRYPLISPYAYAHIYWDAKASELVYEIEEPLLNEQERKILKLIRDALQEVINISYLSEKTQEEILDYIDKAIKLIADELSLTIPEKSYSKLFYYIYRDFIGLNEIEPLLRDYFIEDIECNGINSSVYVVHRIYRNLRTTLIFYDMEYLASLVEKLAQRCGKYISYANPLLDGTLPDGSRVNATYTTEITTKGPTFTIRKFTKIPWSPIQLISFKTVSPEMMAYFWLLIQYKMNLLIAGGTGSGKTSLLNAITFFIPPEARVVSIEDTRELNIPRENWLPSVARTGLGGAEEIDLFTLLKESFRQRPDYVIVGEVRGKEAFVLFQGMASGHPSLSTIHADSVEAVIKRLQTPPISLSPTLLNVLDAIAIMQHALVGGQETRRLGKITEIIEVAEDGTATTNTPFFWDPAEDKFYYKTKIKVFEKIKDRFGLSSEEIENEFKVRTRLLYELYKRKIFDFYEVQKIINRYYKNPKAVIAEFLK